MFIGFRVIGLVATGWSASKASTVDMVGLKVSKETYTGSCVSYAMADPEIKNDPVLTKEFMTKMCGCAYDTGVQQMGYDKFIAADKELAATNVVTPEMNAIVNKCVQESL